MLPISSEISNYFFNGIRESAQNFSGFGFLVHSQTHGLTTGKRVSVKLFTVYIAMCNTNGRLLICASLNRGNLGFELILIQSVIHWFTVHSFRQLQVISSCDGAV